jgi:hypothetical protein
VELLAHLLLVKWLQHCRQTEEPAVATHPRHYAVDQLQRHWLQWLVAEALDALTKLVAPMSKLAAVAMSKLVAVAMSKLAAVATLPRHHAVDQLQRHWLQWLSAELLAEELLSELLLPLLATSLPEHLSMVHLLLQLSNHVWLLSALVPHLSALEQLCPCHGCSPAGWPRARQETSF